MEKNPTGFSSKQFQVMVIAGLFILALAFFVFYFSFFKSSLSRNATPQKAPVLTPVPTLGKSDDFCQSQITGKAMSLQTARDLALAGECGRQADLLGTFACNEYTGTWWLDLDIEKEGCSPACIVNIITKESEINWRCTGIKMEEISLSPAPLPTRSSGCGCGQ